MQPLPHDLLLSPEIRSILLNETIPIAELVITSEFMRLHVRLRVVLPVALSTILLFLFISNTFRTIYNLELFHSLFPSLGSTGLANVAIARCSKSSFEFIFRENTFRYDARVIERGEKIFIALEQSGESRRP